MKLYLTNAGQELLYKAQGGKILKFTRFGLGDGELNSQAIQTLTSLIGEKMSSKLTKVDVKTNKVVVGMSFTNAELTEGFYFKELGLFAEDPDTAEEILYMYANFGETSDYIDANTGKTIEENLDVEIYISDIDNITAVIDNSLVYATQRELTELDNKKVDKEAGKGLSTNDYTTAEKTKLSGIQAGAQQNTITSVNGQTGAVNISIPSKTSDLINDSNFIASTTVTAFWSGTQAAYDALGTHNNTTLYLITEE